MANNAAVKLEISDRSTTYSSFFVSQTNVIENTSKTPNNNNPIIGNRHFHNHSKKETGKAIGFHALMLPISQSNPIPDLRLRLRFGSSIANAKIRAETIVKISCIQNPTHPNDRQELAICCLSEG
jgi:hypothetical protein